MTGYLSLETLLPRFNHVGLIVYYFRGICDDGMLIYGSGFRSGTAESDKSYAYDKTEMEFIELAWSNGSFEDGRGIKLFFAFYRVCGFRGLPIASINFAERKLFAEAIIGLITCLTGCTIARGF
jgi:hypothetical protein